MMPMMLTTDLSKYDSATPAKRGYDTTMAGLFFTKYANTTSGMKDEIVRALTCTERASPETQGNLPFVVS